PTPARSLVENVADSKKIAEDLAEVLEPSSFESAGTPAIDTGMSEAIVKRPLLAVAEHGVGLAGFLEFLFRVGVIGITVGVKLQRKLAISALDLLLSGAALHSQNLVVIAFYVAGQNRLSNPFGRDPAFTFATVLVSGIPCHLHHRRAQHPLLEFVAPLQLFQHLMIRCFGGVDHLDRLMQPGVEWFALGRDGAQAEL